MEIAKKEENGRIVLAPTGRVDTVTAPDFEEAISKLPEDAKALTIDLAGVEYMSSAGLRVVLMAQKRMKQSGGSLKIANVPPPVMNVFRMTGFAGILEIV